MTICTKCIQILPSPWRLSVNPRVAQVIKGWLLSLAPPVTAAWQWARLQEQPAGSAVHFSFLQVCMWTCEAAEFILPDRLICCQSREFSHCHDCWWCSQFALGVFSMASLLCPFCWFAPALQKIRSVSQIFLVFKSVQHFSVLILLPVQMHKFHFSIC